MRPPRKHQGQDGTSFFVTTVTESRIPVFREAAAAAIAQDLIHTYNKRGDFWLSEYVIMPDHVHVLIAPREKNLSECMRNLKRTISEEIRKTVGEGYPSPTVFQPLWQKSFHDMIIRSDLHRETIRNYIFQNPVRTGLAQTPEAYPFSSITKETDRHRMAIQVQDPSHSPPLLIATSNEGKIAEIRECLRGLRLEFFTPLELPYIDEMPIETGATFAENAMQKARFYHERSGLPTLADDSGIIVEALQDELGIHTRRWGAGPKASDAEWIEHFLRRMKNEENKRARFVCTLAYIDGAGILHTFEGICDGVITENLEAPYLPGLPISACFRPDGFPCVYSSMNIEQKNSTSHRGRALGKFRKHIEGDEFRFSPNQRDKT